MKGLSDADAAATEAWEEAGVEKADRTPRPLGHYTYSKQLKNGDRVTARVTVFHLEVKKLAKSFPEKKQRKRIWVSPEDAARRVKEPELKRIILNLG